MYFRRITTLVFVLLVLIYATSINVAYAFHQFKLSTDDIVNAPDRSRRIRGHDMHDKKNNEGSKSFSHSHAMNFPSTDATDPDYKLHKDKKVVHSPYDIDYDAINAKIVDSEGYGVHRRLIPNEGDTEEHRNNMKGIAAELDKKLQKEGETAPTHHESRIPTHHAHGRSDAVRVGPLGAKATRKIREHLITRGIISDDPKAKLHFPHDLHLTEEDYYNDDDVDDTAPYTDEPDEVAEEQEDQQNNEGGGEAPPATSGNSLSKSLSASLPKGAKNASKPSSSASKSKSRRIAGARSRPKQVTKALRYANADFHGDKPTAKELAENVVVADLNAHEKEGYVDPTKKKSPSLVNIHEHEDLQNTHREKVKALLRERQLFYPIQQPRNSLDYVDPADWESFTCQVCSALAEEFATGLDEFTISAHPHRLIEQAEINVTDFYTWRAGSRIDDGVLSRKGKVHFGMFSRTRPDDRWSHKPHTPSETAIRSIVNSMMHHFLVTVYEKEVFFAAMQQIATSQRPATVPSMFVKEELCSVLKEVCPHSKGMYDNGRFSAMLGNFKSSLSRFEESQGKIYEYIRHIQEERELKREIEMEDEADRIAAAHEEAEEKGEKKAFSRSLGIGEVDEHGDPVIIEGKSSEGLDRGVHYNVGAGVGSSQSRHPSRSHNDPEAHETEKRIIEEATREGLQDRMQQEAMEKERERYTASLAHEL